MAHYVRHLAIEQCPQRAHAATASLDRRLPMQRWPRQRSRRRHVRSVPCEWLRVFIPPGWSHSRERTACVCVCVLLNKYVNTLRHKQPTSAERKYNHLDFAFSFSHADRCELARIVCVQYAIACVRVCYLDGWFGLLCLRTRCSLHATHMQPTTFPTQLTPLVCPNHSAIACSQCAS